MELIQNSPVSSKKMNIIEASGTETEEFYSREVGNSRRSISLPINEGSIIEHAGTYGIYPASCKYRSEYVLNTKSKI